MKFPIILNGVEKLVDGTSASTPVRFFFLCSSSNSRLTANIQVVAAIIALLNDYRISNGRPTLGWLNPWLYSRALPGLNDVTSGSNPGCNTQGFEAITGWDPVRSTSYYFFSFDAD